MTESILYAQVFLLFENGAWHAARKLHNDFIRAVMHVSLGWYKKTPIGRIVNRFSSDILSLDLTISPQLRAFLDNGHFAAPDGKKYDWIDCSHGYVLEVGHVVAIII